MKKSSLFMLGGFFVIASFGVCQAQPADNTRINQRDTAQEEMTADKQGQTKTDLEITQDIRKAISNEKSLSINAYNVKIITTSGKVTLKGPVRSEEERKIIEDIASNVVGKENIESEMDIVSK